MKRKWQQLINQIEVVEFTGQDLKYELREIWTEKKLLGFESQTGIILPDDYKTFCQVFGTGIFGDWLRIYCPNIENSRADISYLNYELERELERPDSRSFNIDIRIIIDLLNSAFAFGDTTSNGVFLWDLRSFQEDRSYDIYFFQGPDISLGFYRVGRDFFSFVRDFCLGMQSYELLPEILRPRIQELRHTFARFSTSKISPEEQTWQQNRQAEVELKPTQTNECKSTAHSNLYLDELKHLHIPSALYLDELKHLHIPSDLVYTRSSWLAEKVQEVEKKEEEETKQALQEKNRYAFFRYFRTIGKHTAGVYSVAFSPDGEILASSSADTTIKLWDLRTRQEICTLIGHTNAVISVAFSPDGKTLASSSADTTIKLWDLRTRQEMCTLIGHTNAVISVVFSPDGKTLVSSSADTTIKLWDINTKQEVHTLIGHAHSVLCVAINPDGRTLASSSADSTIKLWNLNNGEEIGILDADCDLVFGVCFHPSKQMLVSTQNGPKEAKSIKFWNLSNGEIIHTIDTYEAVVSVKISPDGQVVAGGGGIDELTIGLWDLNTGKVVAVIRDDPVGCVYHRDLVYAVAFSPDGQILASGSRDATIKLWGLPPPLNV